jgi:hypothetical protein
MATTITDASQVHNAIAGGGKVAVYYYDFGVRGSSTALVLS